MSVESDSATVGQFGFGRELDEVIGNFVAEEASNAVDGIGGSGQFVDQFFVVSQRQMHAWVCECDARELVDDVAEFRGGFFEEASASGCIEEEVVDFHDCPGGAATVAVYDDLTTVAFQFAADFVFVRSSADTEF